MTAFHSHAQPDAAALRLLQSYADQLGGAAPLRAGALAMTVDGQHRIALRALPNGTIAVEARLRSLPEAGAERDRVLLGAARLACGTLRESAAACVVDARERALWLRHTSRATSGQDIDDSVGELVNQLAFWRKTVAAV